MTARKDLFQSPDYFRVDDLLIDEHKLVRDTVRNYVKKEISPIIEDYAQRAEFPEQVVKQLGELGLFWPHHSTEIWRRWYGLYQLWPDDAGTGTRR